MDNTEDALPNEELKSLKAQIAFLESNIELQDDLHRDANKELFTVIEWLANVYLDTSIKTDAVDELLKNNLDFQEPYLDTLQTMKRRGQRTEVARLLEALRKTLRVPL